MENTQISLIEFAQQASRSGMFGQTPEQIYTLAAICHGEGIPVSRALTEYHIIKGKPSLKAEAALSRFQLRGGSVRWLERSDTAAEATFSHAQGGDVTVRWTLEDAKRAGLLSNDTWRKFPRHMLSARCVAEGVRACFPACLGGIKLDTEISDAQPQGTRPEFPAHPHPDVATYTRLLAQVPFETRDKCVAFVGDPECAEPAKLRQVIQRLEKVADEMVAKSLEADADGTQP